MKHTAIEPLEPRIAPAAVFTLTDVDGDLITIKTSKGTNAELAAVITTTNPAGSVPDGVAIGQINLAGNPVFDGTDIAISAKPGPLGGDGLVVVGSIEATGLDLGTVKIKGDLINIDAGKANPASKIKSITATSASGATVWTLNASVGSITIARDLRGTEINLNTVGTNLGLLKIGGSLIGQIVDKTGFISVPNGTIGKVIIGKVIIGGDIIGGGNVVNGFCGSITAKDILSVTIGGSIFGGAGPDSGQIYATGKLGPVAIKGSLIGGTGEDSGHLAASGDLGPVAIKGSIFGGDGNLSAAIRSSANIAAITIGGGMIGGSISSAGSTGPVKIGRDMDGREGGATILSIGGLTSLSVGGSLLGGLPAMSAFVSTATGDIGPVKIGGSMIAGQGNNTATIQSSRNLGSVTVGGNVYGGGVLNGFGSIQLLTSGGTMGAVKIGGNLVSAFITAGFSASTPLVIKSVTIGGRVENGGISSANPDAQIGAVKVGGDWMRSSITTGITTGADNFFGTGDDAAAAGGSVTLFSKIASITIGGQVTGTSGGVDHFGFVSQEIGAMKISGVIVPLTKGRGNDTDVLNTKFILGATRDVTIHELA